MRTIGIFVAAGFALGVMPVWAHDEGTGGPTRVVDNWRDNFIPFFEGGDPKTRHDGDPSNDQSRDDPQTRHESQRWRDEVHPDGTVGSVGEGCMESYCNVVTTEDGDVSRVDFTLSVGPATEEGDRNAVAAEALGAGAEANLGPSQKLPLDFAALPDVSQAEVKSDTEPDDPAEREAPDRVTVLSAGDHSLLGAAHSSSDHRPAPVEGNHDSHGGSIWADVLLPSEDSPTRFRDSTAGVVVLDHLGCRFGCSDEYHTFYPADPERTIYQVGEAPDQAELAAEDPDRWIFGMGPANDTPEVLNPTVAPVTTAAFDEVVNPYVDPAASSATGVGAASSLCCAPAPDGPNAGKFCNRNAGGGLWAGLENEAIVGCVELPGGDCIGGSADETGSPNGCVVIGGQPFYLDGNGVGNDPDECTRRAVEACCDHGNCL